MDSGAVSRHQAEICWPVGDTLVKACGGSSVSAGWPMLCQAGQQ